ncbi:hypothetical protein BH11MYX4_BH11MYX4_44440 [soil metagenome]
MLRGKGASAVSPNALYFVFRRERAVGRRTVMAWLRDKTWSPYAAGILLGLVVAFSEVVCGRPLAASGASDNLAAYLKMSASGRRCLVQRFDDADGREAMMREACDSDAHDHLGRERLCRYLSRPAFSLSLLRMRRDGNVSYRVKEASRGRVTEHGMTPLETLARLAAIVPPPRYPLLRFHGVLAPRHRWRARVVPQPPSAAPRCNVTARERSEERDKGARDEGHAAAPSSQAGEGRAVFPLQARDAVVTSSLTTTGSAEQVAPNVLSIAHWERILDGELRGS